MIGTRAERVSSVSVVAGLVVGGVLRMLHFFADRPLWNDEASLALNVASRDFVSLLRPLEFGQGAPPLYLFLVEATTEALGTSGYSLRLPALVAGLTLLLLVPALGRQVGGPKTVAAATWIVALSPLLVYYSNETKQYAQEALVSVVLITAALRVFGPRSGAPERTWLALAGTLAIWASLASVFLLGVIGLLLLWSLVKGFHREPRWVLGTGTLWASSIFAAYLVSYRGITADPHMQAYWRNTFLPADFDGIVDRIPELVGGLPSATFLHRDIFEHFPPAVRVVALGVVLILAVIGIRRVAAEHGWYPVALCAGPLGLVFLAYLAHRYPMTARLLCFAAPGLVLLVARGWAAVTARLSRPVALGASLVAMTPMAYHATREVKDPSRAHVVDLPVTQWIQRERGPREPVYVTAAALQTWVYYTTNWDDPDVDRIRRAAALWQARSRFNDEFERTGTASIQPQLFDEYFSLHREHHAYPSGIRSEFLPTPGRRMVPGWADGEVARMQSAARPCTWYLSRGMSPQEAAELLPRLAQAGGTTAAELRIQGATGRRICFAPPVTP